MVRQWSWVRTVVAQIGVCFGLYFALQIGQPQKSVYSKNETRQPLDLYFMSVRGGFRPISQQTHLLRQMEKVARTYKARFVVNVGELGEDDPLMKNATRFFPSMKVPWYSTRASTVHDQGGYFSKRVNVSFGKTLDIIGLNTGLLQDKLAKPSDENENEQLHWLTRILKATSGNWHIIFGFHPLFVCDEMVMERMETKASHVFKILELTFTKFEVNAYISGQDCTRQGSISYVENPGSNVKGKSDYRRESINGFLLHRVTSLELVTYFVTLDGEVVHRSVLQQRGREVM